MADDALMAGLGREAGMAAKELGDLRFDGLRQQRTRPVALNLGERIGEGSWLGQLDHVIVGHGVRWRSGGVEHPHDTPPYPLTPSPTSRHSSRCVHRPLMPRTPRFRGPMHSTVRVSPLTARRTPCRKISSGAGGSVIVVDATYDFKTLFGDFVPGMSASMTWTDKTYASPRNSCVDYVKGDNCTKSC